MAISNLQKLMRIDEELMDLEYLYTRELMREKEINKTTFLASRGFKYRIDNLRAVRARLRSIMVQAPTKKMNFIKTLADKRALVVEAEEELKVLQKQYAELMTRVLVTRDDSLAQQAIDLAYEIKVQQRRIKVKENAVDRCLERGAALDQKVHTRESIKYNPERDKSLKHVESPENISQPMASDMVVEILSKQPNWNLSSKPPENNAGELLMPKQRVVIDFDE